MSKTANISPDKTLSASQSLYERYATYPVLHPDILPNRMLMILKMLHAISSINPLASRHKFNRTNKRIVDDSKVESHTAIIPTTEFPIFLNWIKMKERFMRNWLKE